jgi:hypothetical protein
MRLLTLLGVCLLVSSSGYADIINGGFETGLTGWSVSSGTAGNVPNVKVLSTGDLASNDSPSTVSIAAPEGTHYAFISNGPGDLGGLPFDTSILTSDPYLVGAGASISFVLDFFTNELSTINPVDFYTVSVLQGGSPVATLTNGDANGAQTPFPTVDCGTVFLAAPDGTTVCSHSGLQTFSSLDLSPYAGSTIQFQFLVSDQGPDNTTDSALLVDAVSGVGLTDINAPPSTVPEPRSWVLLGTVALLFSVMSRRRFQHR